MSTTAPEPDDIPIRAEEWLAARLASAPSTGPQFTRIGEPRPTLPPPAGWVSEEVDDPTGLPMFAPTGPTPAAGAPGRVRSGFSLSGAEPAARLVPYPVRPAAPHPEAEEGLDWDLVAQYGAEVSARLTARLEKVGDRLGEQVREQLGVEIIEELVKAEAEGRVSAGLAAWSPLRERELKQALFDALFGLGRLQPLVDDDTVENVIVTAKGPQCRVWLDKTDGSLVPGPAVADSEDQLREFLAALGARQNRPFTEARPSLHLRLPGGSRLAAASWVTAQTSVVIRRHRLVEVSLADMVDRRGACGPVLADFLGACVRAGKSIVVSGVQGSGKTTWVRALASCIPPWEMIGTFETEFELGLHELAERHHIVHAWEHRPGSGEAGIDGRLAGQFTLEEAIHDSFRFILARQIVGEVRGPEVWNMLKAMESGPGSISTTHARSADHTIEKLVSCAMEKGPQVTRELAISKLAAAVDVVVHLRADVTEVGEGTSRKRRWVEEVLIVDPSADAVRGYATAPVFAPNRLGQAVATGKLDDRFARELARHGFDLEAYTTEAKAHEGVEET